MDELFDKLDVFALCIDWRYRMAVTAKKLWVHRGKLFFVYLFAMFTTFLTACDERERAEIRAGLEAELRDATRELSNAARQSAEDQIADITDSARGRVDDMVDNAQNALEEALQGTLRSLRPDGHVEIPVNGGFWTDMGNNHRIFLTMEQAEALLLHLEITKIALSEVTQDIISDILSGTMDVLEVRGAQGITAVSVGTATSEEEIMQLVIFELAKQIPPGLEALGLARLSPTVTKVLIAYAIGVTGVSVSYRTLTAYHRNRDVNRFMRVLENSRGKDGFIILSLRESWPAGFGTTHQEDTWYPINPNPFINFVRDYVGGNNVLYEDLLYEVQSGIVSFNNIPTTLIPRIERCLRVDVIQILN